MRDWYVGKALEAAYGEERSAEMTLGLWTCLQS